MAAATLSSISALLRSALMVRLPKKRGTSRPIMDMPMGFSSMSVTCTPARAASMAAAVPDTPAPTTTSGFDSM